MSDRVTKVITLDGSNFNPKPSKRIQWSSSIVNGQVRKIDLPAMQDIQKINAELGRRAWSNLHSYTGCDPDWYASWKKTIPSFGCSCRRDFDVIEKELPPDFSSDDAFFVRGVEWHNAVNRKLNKPEITIEEARSIWRKE
jgi:hypothetical protein